MRAALSLESWRRLIEQHLSSTTVNNGPQACESLRTVDMKSYLIKIISKYFLNLDYFSLTYVSISTND